MAYKPKATAVILDVGKGVGSDTDAESFFTRGKHYVRRFLEQKIFADSKDEFSLILVGTDSTANNLNETLDGYEHIVVCEGLKRATFHDVSLLDMTKQEQADGDWLDAIVVALELLRSSSLAKKFSGLEICLISNFASRIKEDNLNSIQSTLDQMDIKMTVVSDHIRVDTESQELVLDIDGSGSQVNKNVITSIFNKINTIIVDINEEVRDEPLKSSRGTKFDLEIGTKIVIPVSMFVATQKSPVFPPLKIYSDKGQTHRVKEHFADDKPFTFDLDELIDAYIYGKTPIPYDRSFDEGDSLFGGKSLKVIGFSRISRIQNHYITGRGARVITSDATKSVSFKALIIGMQRAEKAMICRYVWNRNSSPKMVVLYPQQNNSVPSLAMFELIYAENISHMTFPPLIARKNPPTEKQLELVGDLINKMMLEPNEFRTLTDPTRIYKERIVMQKALRPREVITKPDEDIIQLTKPPMENVDPELIKCINDEFKLEHIQISAKEKLFAKLHIISTGTVKGTPDDAVGDNKTAGDFDLQNLVEVGSVQPAEDFAALIHRGEKFADVCQQIQFIIDELVFKSLSLPLTKLAKALVIFRETAKIYRPFQYNEFLTEFKVRVVERKKFDFWKLVEDECLGLITRDECENSTVTMEEAAEFLVITNTVTSNDISRDDLDVDSMFGEI